MPRKRLKKKYLYYKGYKGKMRIAKWSRCELATAFIRAIRLAKQIKLALEKYDSKEGTYE